MNYSEPLISQITVFFRAVGCGILLGIVYDIISLIRMLFGERKGVYVFFDTAYFILASVISFFFMVLYNSGQIRLNIMLAEMAGGIAFHFSLGKYMLKSFSRELEHLRKLLSFLARPFVKTAGRVCTFLKSSASITSKELTGVKNIEKIRKIFSDIGKKLLKNQNKSV